MIKWMRASALVLTAAVLFSGCAEQPAAPKLVGQVESTQRLGSGYELGAGDKVRLIVFGEDNLSGEFSISSSGTLSFPLIGEVPAEHRTVDQVREDVVQRLNGRYVRAPHVSLEVITYRPFYILGEVNKPGEFPFEPDLTVLGAVAAAQGFTYRANTRFVYIKHAGEGKEARFPLTGDLEVRPGDVVRVGERLF